MTGWAWRKWALFTLALMVVAGLGPVAAAPNAAAHAGSLPPDFNEQEFVRGLDRPTSMSFAPDGRLFVSEKGGTIRIVENGVLLPTPFASLTVDDFRERGLLGLAFDPDFATNQFVYAFLSDPTPSCHHQITRLTANGNVLAPGSETTIFDMGACGAGGHNAGSIHFGQDQKLYIATGEQNIASNAQSMNNLFGKILRINADGTIPTDNPFYNTATGANRAIWALGLRNPFTFAFQPSTGRTLVNDVGEHEWEEVSEATAGDNLGWPQCEAYCAPSDPTYTDPVFAYPHGEGDTAGCAITGGTFYEPAAAQFPATYMGKYFFADYCSGWIRYLDPANGFSVHDFMQDSDLPVDIDVGPDGRLYYLTRQGGPAGAFVQVIEYSLLPGISKHPTLRSGGVGSTVRFNVLVTGNGPFTFQWQKDGVDIPGGTSQGLDYTVGANDAGAMFRVVVSNSAGTVISNEAPLDVTGNTPPVATISLPTVGQLYQGGSAISYAGTGTDAEDGALPPSAFTWEIVFHHDAHTHPFLEPFSGVDSGNFVIPDDDHTDVDVWYRIHMTVTDSTGSSHSVYRDVFPRQRALKFDTYPPGLEIGVDQIPRATPVDELSVVGVKRELSPGPVQTHDGANWAFDSWSDRGAPTHVITTPTTNKRYTAVYRVIDGLVGAGTGLDADYFDNDDLTGLAAERRDQTVNFRWGVGHPIAGVDNDTFSVRWEGSIQAQFTEQYDIIAKANDGVRMWLDGALVIDAWNSVGTKNHVTSAAMVAGELVDIVIEFREQTGNSRMQLFWSSPSTPESIVPMSQLHPGGTTGTNTAPTAVIDMPAGSDKFEASTTIPFSGSATDAQDGVLSPAAFTWEVVLHHTGGSEIVLPETTGTTGGTFDVPLDFSGDPDSFYRIRLTVTDSGGLTDTVFFDMLPMLTNVHLTTSPAGLDVTFDGVAHTTPETIVAVRGSRHELAAVEPQSALGTTFVFDSWSDRSTATHLVRVRGGNRRYEAVYRVDAGAVGSGVGLDAAYFNDVDLTLLHSSRVDQTINFKWGGRPKSGLSEDNFGIRWTGTLAAQFTEDYTLTTISNNGVRVWIDGQLVIDNWIAHPRSFDTAVVSLTAGQAVDIVVEFFETVGAAEMRLLWSSASTPESVVPRSQLEPVP